MTNNRALGMIGLAMRAGKVASGAFQVEKAFEAGNAHLLLADRSISEQALEKYKALCASKQCEMILLDEDELSVAIGKPGRMAAAILDINFSRKITELIHGGV